MIAIDSNVLVRWLVQDDPQQYRRVVRLFARIERAEERYLVGSPEQRDSQPHWMTR